MALTFLKTVAFTATLTVLPIASAFAEQKPGQLEPGQAYTCVSASRGGLSLAIPGLNEGGDLAGSLRLFKLARTIREISAERIVDYVNDGDSISMKGQDEDGKTVVEVVSARDEHGNLQVRARIQGAGLIGFACKQAE